MLAAFGHVLSFLVLFAAIADATERSRFGNTPVALVFAVLAIQFTKLYVKIIMDVRLDAAHPPRRIPAWAVAVYAAVGLVFVLLALRAGETGAAAELLVGWAAGCHLLNYLWTRRLHPDTPAATDICHGWLSAQAAAHRTLTYTVAFLLLFAAVGTHAFQTGFARVAAAQCGPPCASIGFVYTAAALSGLASILFVMLYATIIEGLRWILVERWMHVRPGPPPPDLPPWVAALHLVVGFLVFLGIAVLGGVSLAPGSTYVAVDGASGKEHVLLNGASLLALLVGWWIGGTVVLRFFWLRRRARR